MMMQMKLTPGYFDRCVEHYNCCVIDGQLAALQGEPFIIEEYDNVTVYAVTATTENGLRYFVRFELHGMDEIMDYEHPTYAERIAWKYRKSPSERV